MSRPRSLGLMNLWSGLLTIVLTSIGEKPRDFFRLTMGFGTHFLTSSILTYVFLKPEVLYDY